MGDIIREIGILTLKFSKLEHLCLKYISVLISGDNTLDNQMLFQDYSLHKKLEALRTLISLKHDGRFEQIQLNLIKRINTLKDKRNYFIHGDWNISDVDQKTKINQLSIKENKYKFRRPKDGIADKTKDGLADKTWKPGKLETFGYQDINDLNNRLTDLINELNNIISKNEEILGK